MSPAEVERQREGEGERERERERGKEREREREREKGGCWPPRQLCGGSGLSAARGCVNGQGKRRGAMVGGASCQKLNILCSRRWVPCNRPASWTQNKINNKHAWTRERARARERASERERERERARARARERERARARARERDFVKKQWPTPRFAPRGLVQSWVRGALRRPECTCDMCTCSVCC